MSLAGEAKNDARDKARISCLIEEFMYIYEVYNETTGEVACRRTSRAVAQQDVEILRWLVGGRWYVRERSEDHA